MTIGQSMPAVCLYVCHVHILHTIITLALIHKRHPYNEQSTCAERIPLILLTKDDMSGRQMPIRFAFISRNI